MGNTCKSMADSCQCMAKTSTICKVISLWLIKINGKEKVGSQETSGITGKFGLGVQNEAGQRLIEFCQENTLVIANTLFQQHKRRFYTWTSPDGRHQNQIDYFLAAKDAEGLYSQQKQDRELTVAQIMNSLLPNSDWNWRKWRKPLDHSGMTYVKSLMSIQWKWEIDLRD